MFSKMANTNGTAGVNTPRASWISKCTKF
jgi:hypothetical protein